MATYVDFGAPASATGDRGPEEAGRGYLKRRPAEAARPGGGKCAIDHAHLARYTLGDRALEVEVLELFVGEAPRTLARLRAACEAEHVPQKEWQLASHTLKGSARAVGAWKVADHAEAAEHSPLDDRGALLDCLTRIELALGEVIGHVAGLKVTANELA